jgi:alkylhydroperoxidase family enzyme
VELQSVFEHIMPPGVPPLSLFAALARVPRVWDRLRAGSLLDRGPVSLRHREIVIHRTCARCSCPYEWGVHAAFFADRARLTPEQLRATVHGDANDAVWAPEEKLLIRLADELHETADISEDLWQLLRANFSIEEILELITQIGRYHTISFFANGLRLRAESYAIVFPSK